MVKPGSHVTSLLVSSVVTLSCPSASISFHRTVGNSLTSTSGLAEMANRVAKM